MRKRYKKTGQKTKIQINRPETEWISIRVPAIIDQTDFQAAQERLRQNKTLTKKAFSHPFLLSGIIYCGVCGRRMLAHQCVFRSGNYKPYYQCCSQRYANLRNAELSCKARSIPANTLDGDVWELLKTAAYDPKKVRRYLPAQKPTFNQGELERLGTLEVDLAKKQEAITRWFRQHMLSEQQAEKQLGEIHSQLLAVQKRKRELADQNKSHSDPDELFDRQEPTFDLSGLTDAEKRRLLRSAIKKITVTRTDNAKGSNQPAYFKITLETI